jgi:DNA-binding MarR family transcriptional regulator
MWPSQERWGAETTRLGFTLVPNLLFRLNAHEQTKDYERINPTEMIVLLTILSHWINPQAQPYPGIERIARYTNLSGRHVRRVIHSLVAKKYLTIHRQGDMDSRRNSFSFRPIIERLAEVAKILAKETDEKIGDDSITKLEIAERLGLFRPSGTSN